MQAYRYVDKELHVEDVPVRTLAEEYGTPLYVYSRSHMREQYRLLSDVMADVDPLICYSVKANSNAAVINTFREEGAGVDVVSGGELYRALKAGVDPSMVVFAGVGKSVSEIQYALEQGILFFTVESEPEAVRISAVASRLGVSARIAFRVNPDVDPRTHKYTTTGKKENKFGLDLDRAEVACAAVDELGNVDLVGLHMHIGSQILNAEPFGTALNKLRTLCRTLADTHRAFEYIDIGGGIGIQYEASQEPMMPSAFAATVIPMLKELGLKVVMEPGRFLVGNAGCLVCRVEYVKDNPLRKFIVADAGMNDLIRPSLYEAYHDVLAVRETEGKAVADLVGPICESGDFIAKERELPNALQGDLLAVMSAGAYGFSMSSNYNSRPRAAEVIVEGDKTSLVRERETWDDLLSKEVAPQMNT